MDSDKSSTDGNGASTRNAITNGEAQEEIAKTVGIDLKDLNDSEILTDRLSISFQ